MANEKQKELVNVLSGKATEPKFTGLVYTKMDLIKALNHYAAYAKTENLKAWALTYLVKYHPELVKRVQSLPGSCFTTYGALCRLEARGYAHDDTMKARIRDYFKDLKAPVTKLTDEEPAAPKPVTRKPIEKINKSMEAFDIATDDVLMGKQPANFTISTTDSVKEIEEICHREIKEMTEFPDYYQKHRIPALKKFYKATLEKVEKAKAAKKVKAPVVRSKRVNPAAVVKAVKYQKSEDSLGLVSINPVDVLERRKMFVYDTKYRRLIMFVSTGPGFTFTGTTLQNVDMKKSVFKTVRKPEALFKGKKLSISDLNKAFDELKTKETPMPAARFNSYFVIVKVTEKGN